MKILIVTGISGSGKTVTIKTLEDLGYYTVDNIPVELIHDVLSLTKRAGINLVTLGVSPKTPEIVRKFLETFESLKKEESDLTLIFLDAKDETIIRRYKETRRKHPFEEERTIEKAIEMERKLLSPIAEIADIRVDTTDINIHQLRRKITAIASAGKESMVFYLISFGFKYGIPPESDLVFDVRFVKNPNFIPGLRELDGTHPEVQNFVFSDEGAIRYLEMIKEMIRFLKDRLIKDGRYTATISVGCTGGKHRSAAFVEKIKEFIEDELKSKCIVNHRDREKESPV